MAVRLDTLDDDTLIYVFAFLAVPEILSIRQVTSPVSGSTSGRSWIIRSQTCWRIYRLSSLRIVWLNACVTHILNRRYPFPPFPIDAMDAPELERRTRHAYHLATKWQSTSCEPEKMVIFDATSATPLTDLRFLPGRDGKWLLTVSKGIWSVMSLWDIGDGLRRIVDWSPKDGQLHGFAVNTDPDSPATLVVSIFEDRSVTLQSTDPPSLMRVSHAFKFTAPQLATYRGPLSAVRRRIADQSMLRDPQYDQHALQAGQHRR